VVARLGGSTELDYKCIVGMCCPHGTPLQGGFIASPAHENFSLYDQLLGHMLRVLGLDLAAFVLDFNCKYWAHARKDPELAQLLRDRDAAAAEKGQPKLGFHVGWLHSNSGHKLECQLRFSSMFQVGMGRLIGEPMEQLHVSISLSAGLQACMSSPCSYTRRGALATAGQPEAHRQGASLRVCPAGPGVP
jgi:hypothetical protein